MKKILIAIPLMFSSVQTLAAEAANSERNVVSSSSAAAPNIKNSADTSKKQNDSAGMISKVIGVGMMAMGASYASKSAACFSGCPYGCCPAGPGLAAKAALAFLMGAQSFKQASNHGGASGESAMTGIDTSAWNNPFGDPNSKVNHLSTDDSGKDKGLAAQVNTGKFNEIKGQLFNGGIGGFKMDPKTGILTDKDGKTYDPNNLTDAKAMADAGFSADSISSAMSTAAALEKAALKKLGVTTEGIGAATAENGYSEGGSTGSISGNPGDSADGYGGRGIASSGAGIKIPSNQIAGLTKNFNGERIGVSAENIFNMMTRRYKTKEKQNSFFDPSELVKMPQ